MKLRTVSMHATEKEVSAFRGLDARLEAARAGRDRALKDFHDMHQQALGQVMPRVPGAAAAGGAAAEGAHRGDGGEGARARRRERRGAPCPVVADPPERDRQGDREDRGQDGAPVHKVHAAFRRAAAHEGATLGRRLRKVAHEAEERAARECSLLHKQSDAHLAAVASGRSEVDGEMRETAAAVRLELSRVASEWQAALQQHYKGAREQLGRTLLDHQAAHRDERAQRRVVDASYEQAKRAALSKREALLVERQSAVQKEVDAIGVWLAKRLETASAAASGARSRRRPRPARRRHSAPRRLREGVGRRDAVARSSSAA